MTRRAIRAQRKAKEEMRHMTGYAVSNEPYMDQVYEGIARRADDVTWLNGPATFTLHNGTEIDPKSAWPLPGKVKEN